MPSVPIDIPDNAPKTSRPSRWFYVVAIVLAVILLYFSLRGMDWAEFQRIISTGQYAFLGVVVVLGSINYFVRSLRWRVLLQKDNHLPVLPVFWANMVGYLGNAYLPARAGEILRSAALSRKTGTSVSFIFATALVERIMDVVALIIVGAISLGTIGELPPVFQTATKLFAVIALGGLIFLLFLPSLEPLIQSVIQHLIANENWRAKILEFVKRFIQGFSVLRDGKRMGIFIVFTAAIWLIDGILAGIEALIIHQTLSLPQALLLLSGLGLSSALPSTPGYVGVYQFVAANILAPFHFSQSEALAYILVLQIANYIVVSFWGLIGLWKVQ